MPDIRQSQREGQEAGRQESITRQHEAAREAASQIMQRESQAAERSASLAAQHRVRQSDAQAGEWFNDRGVQFDHILPDAQVRLNHAVRQWQADDERIHLERQRAQEARNLEYQRTLEARERVLYPENTNHPRAAQRNPAVPTTQHDAATPQHDASAPHHAAPRAGQPHEANAHAGHHDATPTQHHDSHHSRRDAGRQPSTHSDHPRSTDNARPGTDYVVRRGDNLSSIVRADEERRHHGTHNARQEQLRVRALVDRYGETILPEMHIDLSH
ncbi:hypothetical protein BH10CYA1_BH10CYA1_46000 [soil metagenome]